VLDVGCGNSSLAESMFDHDRFANVNCIDTSAIVIKSMIERNQTMRPDLKFMQMDCTKLLFPDKYFDLVIDKATMDTLLTGDKPYLTVARYLKEV
jgi:ubiquinone/menaquinone biosynthesis C-methylase UbiE